VALSLGCGVLAPAAPARPTPTAIVSLGDSIIAGNAGRLLGNSDIDTGGRAGTDRAWLSDSIYDPSRVHLNGSVGGCFRSDVAELLNAARAGRANLPGRRAARARVLVDVVAGGSHG